MAYTLNINFPPTVPAPALGYRVRYWPVSNPASISTLVVAAPPAVVIGLTEFQYAGDVSVICGLNNYGPLVPFNVTATGPLTSTLTFVGYAAGEFTFSLSNTLTVPLTIEQASVDGFDNFFCGIGGGVSLDILFSPNYLTIPAGLSVGYQTGAGFGCSILAYKRGSQIKIAGNPAILSNGSTFSIGGTTVTVAIDTANCDPYAC